MTIKSTSIKALILVTVLAVSAAGMEYAIRMFFPVYDPSGQVEFQAGKAGKPNLGTANTRFRQRKNTGDFDVEVVFNKYGLRDDKDLANGTMDDIFVVGDSFSFGWGIEVGKRYSDRLQKLTGIRVFNISTPGNFDGYQKLIRYASGKGARIKYLVIGVCMENDLINYAVVKPSGGKGFVFSLGTFKNLLTKYSALYGMVTTVIHSSPVIKWLAVRLGMITPNLEGVPNSSYSQQVIKASVNRLATLAKGFRVTALIIPSRSLWVGAGKEDADRSHREFIIGVREAGLEIIDLRDAFEKTGDPLALHFANDGHWNPQGHEIAARALAEAFRPQGKL